MVKTLETLYDFLKAIKVCIMVVLKHIISSFEAHFFSFVLCISSINANNLCTTKATFFQMFWVSCFGFGRCWIIAKNISRSGELTKLCENQCQ